jgi:uncharacterized membrane protein
MIFCVDNSNDVISNGDSNLMRKSILTPKNVFRMLLAAFMVTAGTLHFADPAPFVKIVPDYLPCPRALVFISGFFEILGGVGLLIPRVSRLAAWGLIALFVAVFPANIHMAIHQLPFGDAVYPIGNWLRLPFQGVLIAWAYWFTKE